MQTLADRLQPLPKHISRVEVRRRVFNGVCVDVSEVWGPGGEGLNEMAHPESARVTGLLAETGAAPCEPRLDPERPCEAGYVPRNIQFAPAGQRLWGYCADVRYVRDVSLVFQPGALEARIEARLDMARLSDPRLRFSDDALWTLMRLLSEAVDQGDPASQLYGDALVLAAMARLHALSPARGPAGGLAPWQLRRVLEVLEERLPQPVALADLAATAQLSQAHFARAFKAATGLAPYQYQLRARIRRAQALLEVGSMTLEEIAEATGFVDASHLARRFRSEIGVTPAAWRRTRRS